MTRRTFRTLTLGCLALLAVGTWANAEPLSVSDFSGPMSSAAEPNMKDVTQAVQLFNRGDQAGAYALLQQTKKAHPELSPAEVMMAQLHFSAGQVPAGYAMLEKARQTAPDDPEPLVILLERATRDGRLTEAGLLAKEAQKSLDGFKDSSRRKQAMQARVYSVAAALDENAQKFEEAKAQLAALLKLDEKNAGAHQRLGRVLVAQGGSDAQKQALAEFNRAAELDPNALPAVLMMAALSKDPAKAEQWIDFGIKQAPNDARIRLGAADYFLKTGQLGKAREQAEAAIKVDAKSFDANLLTGLVENLSGDYAKAAEYLSRAHLMQPSNPAIINQLTLALLESPDATDQARAVQYAELNARMQPENLEQQATLGWAYLQQQRMADAERVFKAIFNRPPGSPLNVSGDTSFILAAIAANQGKTEDAKRMLKPIVESKQLFVYRPKAEMLLEQLEKGVNAVPNLPSELVPSSGKVVIPEAAQQK